MKFIRIIELIFLLPFRLFSKISVLSSIKGSKIHKTSAVFSGSRVYWCEVGKYTYISTNCIICKTKIGNYCSIAGNCIVSAGKHPVNMVSTSPVFYASKNNLNKCFNVAEFTEFDETVIGNDVWIGVNAFIKGGISIGDGAIIGAYSVVTKDVEPYTIVAGNPARVIRKRFDDAVIEALQKSKWWELDEIELQKKAKYFADINSFIKSYNNG